MAVDPRFAGNPLRVKNRDALRPILAARLLTRSAQEWEQACTSAGVPVSHVRGLGVVSADEQVRARNMVKSARLGTGREIPTWGVPVKVNNDLSSPLLDVPLLDQHHEQIVADLERRAMGSAERAQ